MGAKRPKSLVSLKNVVTPPSLSRVKIVKFTKKKIPQLFGEKFTNWKKVFSLIMSCLEIQS